MHRSSLSLILGLWFGAITLPAFSAGPGVIKLDAAQLAERLGERTEVVYLAFRDNGDLLIGGVAPYAKRSMEQGVSDEAASSGLGWNSPVEANWAIFHPKTGKLDSPIRSTSPTVIQKKFTDLSLMDLQPPADTPFPFSGGGDPKLVIEHGNFALALYHADPGDDLGTLGYFRRQTPANTWTVYRTLNGCFPQLAWISENGRWLVYRFQPDGYDGPEPWCLFDLAARQEIASHRESHHVRTEMIGIGLSRDFKQAATAWSDGSVHILPLP